MPNERLRDALMARGLTCAVIAERVEVDQKTVERWIASDRVPRRTHRCAVASLVGIDEGYLWPTALNANRLTPGLDAELVTLYPTRGAVPRELWLALINEATTSIDALMFAGLFLTDTGPDLGEALARQARSGVRIRLLLGDPDSETVAIRGREEGIGDGLAARIRISGKYLHDAALRDGVELRWHTTTLYNSIYRCDDNMLVNAHVYGAPASQNPVLHLRRVPTGRVFDHYLASFDRVWATGTPQAKET